MARFPCGGGGPTDDRFIFKGTELTGLTDKGKDALEANKELTIPAGTTKIGAEVFSGKGLTKVTLPDSVTEVAERAFYDNQIAKLKAPGLIKIGEGAFQKNQLTTFTSGTVTSIGEGAFSDNQLTKVNITDGRPDDSQNSPTRLTTISKNAFRDNKLTEVTLPKYVTEIGASAFANNQLKTINLPPQLQTVGQDAFSGNQIKEVKIPATITAFGKEVFSNNKRWVVLEKADEHSSLPAAVTSQKYATGFGQVVVEDAVSITINYLDADTNKPLRGPQVLQSEFTEPDGVYFAGAPNTVKAPVFTGYEATESSKEFTPVKGEKNEVTFVYKKTDFSPKISGEINKFIPYGGKGDAKALLNGVTATDTDGGNITASLTVSPKSVNTKVQDASYDVYYTATDSQGRTKTVKGKIAVGTDWSEKTICPGWQVKDFTYDGGTITGFSSTGRDKHRAGKTKDPWCWPTVGDKGQPITAIGSQVRIFYEGAFNSIGLTRLPDSWGNITRIGENAFGFNQISRLPDSWGNITSIGREAFNRSKISWLPDSWGNITEIEDDAFASNRIARLPDSWENITSIGEGTFRYNEISRLPDSWGKLTSIGEGTFKNNEISRLPDSWEKLTAIEGGAFRNNKISRLPDSWENITKIGGEAFYSNKIVRLPDSWGNIDFIGTEAFRYNQISRLPDSWGNITEIRYYAFDSNQISRLPDSWGNIRTIGAQTFNRNPVTQLPKSLGKIFSLGNETFPNTIPAGQIFTVPDERLEIPLRWDYGIPGDRDYRKEGEEGKCQIDYENDKYVYNRLQLSKDYFSRNNLAGLKAPIYLVPESGVNRCKVTGIPGRIVILGNTNVHIQYQDFNGNPVHPPQDVNVRFDESNAKGEYVFSAPPVEGYILPKSQAVAIDGIDKTITFKYLKETKVHIEYVDTTGKELRPSEDISLTEENGDETGKYLVKAPQIYGYTKPDSQTITLDGKPKNIVFEYKEIPGELLKTYGYLNLVGKKIINKQGENTELPESRILEDAIGQKLRTDLSFGGVEGASEVKDGYVEIKYDPVAVEYVEDALSSVEGFTEVKVSAPGILRIKLKPNSNFSRSVVLPIHWRLKPYVSAANKAYPLTAQLYDTDSEGNSYLVPPHRLSRPGPVYLKGFYQLPAFAKTVGGCKDHCTVYLPKPENNPSNVSGNTVAFGFETNNLQRNVQGYTITDQLPTYTKADGTTALAQFKASENPGWELESDKKTLTYSINIDDANPLKGSSRLGTLKLNFPDAKTFESIQNHASFVLTPQDQGENEPLITGNASTTFSFRPQPKSPESHPDTSLSWVNKNAQGPHQLRGQTVIYDTKQDRNQEITWDLVTDNSRVDGKSITVEDYDLDGRLIYTGIKPDPLFVGGTVEILSSTGEKEKVIYTQTINDNSRLEIPYEVAKYHRIWLRLTSKPTVSDRVQTKTEVYSKLRDPSKVLCANNSCGKVPALTNWVRSGSYKDRAEIKILPEGKTLKALKTSNYENLTVTGKSGIYTVGAEMETDYADPLTNFKLIDILPRGLEIKSINLTGAFATLPGASYKIDPNFKQTGLTAIIFEADQVSEPQDIYTVAQIETFITRGAPDGQFTNQAFVQAVGKVKYVNQIENPIAGNGLWSRAEVKKVVSVGTDTFVSGWIRHNNSRSPWTQEISTVAGQKFFYQLRAAVGNKDEKHPVIYDLLPVEGVTARPGSTLINQYDSNSKITIEMGDGRHATGWNTFYTCDTGISRDDLVTATWYDRPSCGNVTGLKFENPQALKARSEVRITIPMIAGPKGADVFSSVHNGKQALNDFTYSSDANYLALASGPVINTLTPPKVNIEFQKYGTKFMPFQGFVKSPLAGAKFGLFNKEEQLVNTAISGKDGKVSFKNVDAAPDWTIREIQAPLGYEKWDKKYVLSKDDFKTYDAGTASYQIRKNPVINMGTGLVIEPVKGTLEFQKVDKTGQPLSGIEFTITPQPVRQNDGSMVAPNSAPITLRSNSDGKVKFYNIPAGKWRLTENPGERHLQPISPIDFTITHCSGKGCTPTRGKDLKLGENGKVTNNKGRVSLSKLGVRGMADKKKAFGQWQRSDGVITGEASFKLYKGRKDTDPNPREFTTGSDGQKNFILQDLDLDQVYTLEETVPPSGYIKNDALLQFQIDGEGRLRDASGKKQLLEQSELLVPNEEQKKQSSLVVTKVDPKAAEAEKYLADAEFGLFKQAADGTWPAAPIKKQTTDATGQTVFNDLDGGVYRVKELKAPKGYYVDPQAQYEFVVDDYKAQQFTWTASNERSRLRVFKFEPLVNSIDEVAADKVVSGTPGAIKIPSQVAGTFNVVIPLKGAKFALYENDETTMVAKDLVTDKDGYVEVPATVKLDPDKVYKLKETKEPAGYILKSNPISVKISDYALLKGFTGLVTVEVPNTKDTGRVTVSKLSKETGKPLAGAEFTLTAPDRTKKTLVTNDVGLATFTGLTFGVTYRIQETNAPAGYMTTDEGEDVTLTADNPVRTFKVYNQLSGTWVELNKVSDTGTPIEGVVFELSQEGASGPAQTLTTDKDGKVKFKVIPGENYILKETQTSRGYALLPQPVRFKVAGNGEVTVISGKGDVNTVKGGNGSLTVINYPEGKLPLSGYAGSLEVLLLGCLVLGIAMLFTLFERKRK